MRPDASVTELLVLHRELAQRLNAIERKLRCDGVTVPTYEVASIDDPEVIEAVAAALYQVDGGRNWSDATPQQRSHYYESAATSIVVFLKEFSNRSTAA